MNPAINTFAVVLAAGKSKRLGRAKALLHCGEKTLIKFIVDRLESINLPNNFLIFKDNVNLMLSIFEQNAEITIKNVSKLSYEFPDELEYRNYYFQEITNIKIDEEIIWDDDFAFKIFNNIEFFLNDQKIDSLNEEIYKIDIDCMLM